jgi:hypothetical protein
VCPQILSNETGKHLKNISKVGQLEAYVMVVQHTYFQRLTRHISTMMRYGQKKRTVLSQHNCDCTANKLCQNMEQRSAKLTCS